MVSGWVSHEYERIGGCLLFDYFLPECSIPMMQNWSKRWNIWLCHRTKRSSSDRNLSMQRRPVGYPTRRNRSLLRISKVRKMIKWLWRPAKAKYALIVHWPGTLLTMCFTVVDTHSEEGRCSTDESTEILVSRWYGWSDLSERCVSFGYSPRSLCTMAHLRTLPFSSLVRLIHESVSTSLDLFGTLLRRHQSLQAFTYLHDESCHVLSWKETHWSCAAFVCHFR